MIFLLSTQLEGVNNCYSSVEDFWFFKQQSRQQVSQKDGIATGVAS